MAGSISTGRTEDFDLGRPMTRCETPPKDARYAEGAGTRMTPASRSTSAQLSPRTSPGRMPVRMRTSIASAYLEPEACAASRSRRASSRSR